MKHKAHVVTVETSTIVRILLLITAFVLGIGLLMHLKSELIWIGTAFFLAVSLDPAVNAVSSVLRVGRLTAALLVFVAFLILMGILAVSLVPPLISQSEALVGQLPHYLQEIQNSHGYVGQLVQHYQLVERVREIQPKLLQEATAGTGPVLEVLRSIFTGLTAVLTILVITFFMLLEGPQWITKGWRYVPVDEQSHYHRITTQMYKILAEYMNGNLIIAGAVVLITAGLLALTGVPYAIPLGIVAGLTTLIPIVGAFIAFLLVGGAALFTSVTAGIVIAVFFLLYGLLDGHVIRPLLFSKTIQMSPLVVMIALVIGTAMAGIIGALVAIPVAACLGVVLSEIIRPGKAK